MLFTILEIAVVGVCLQVFQSSYECDHTHLSEAGAVQDDWRQKIRDNHALPTWQLSPGDRETP